MPNSAYNVANLTLDAQINRCTRERLRPEGTMNGKLRLVRVPEINKPMYGTVVGIYMCETCGREFQKKLVYDQFSHDLISEIRHEGREIDSCPCAGAVCDSP